MEKVNKKKIIVLIVVVVIVILLIVGAYFVYKYIETENDKKDVYITFGYSKSSWTNDSETENKIKGSNRDVYIITHSYNIYRQWDENGKIKEEKIRKTSEEQLNRDLLEAMRYKDKTLGSNWSEIKSKYAFGDYFIKFENNNCAYVDKEDITALTAFVIFVHQLKGVSPEENMK